MRTLALRVGIFALAVFFSRAAVAGAPEAVPGGAELTVEVDPYNNILLAGRCYGKEFYGPEQIREFFENCRENGVKSVFWRCFRQIANYPSRLNYDISQIDKIRSSPDTRRSQGAFSAKVGVMYGYGDFNGGLTQRVGALEKHVYSLSADILSEQPGACLAVLDPGKNMPIVVGDMVVSPDKFQRSEVTFEYEGPFVVGVVAKGRPDIQVFVADNISLKDEMGNELAANGGMEEVSMLKPANWEPWKANFMILNGDHKAMSREDMTRFFPKAGDQIRRLEPPPESADSARKTMAACNPLAEAVKHARKNGVKIYACVDPVDDGRVTIPPIPAWSSRFMEEHPELRLADGEGRTKWGSLCFGYKKVRNYKTEIIRELLSYGVDGIVLKTSYLQNMIWDGNVYDYKDYLHNDVALSEYARVKGAPRSGEYDIGLLQVIHGRFFMEWVAEAASIVRGSGRKLFLEQKPSKYLDASCGAWRMDPVQAVEMNLVDGLFLEPRLTHGNYAAYLRMLDYAGGYSRACSKNNTVLGMDYHLSGLVESRQDLRDKDSYFLDQLVALGDSPAGQVGVFEGLYVDYMNLWGEVEEAHKSFVKSAKGRRRPPPPPMESDMKGRVNVASFESGATARVVVDGLAGSAVEIIDGDITDGSSYATTNMPVKFEVSFQKPASIDTVRIYPGRISLAMSPTGDCGPSRFRVEGFFNGKWFDLVGEIDCAARIRNFSEKAFLFNHTYRFHPVTLEKVRVNVLKSSDTGRRIVNEPLNLAPESERIVCVREIQAFAADPASREAAGE